jgi:2-phospho-L-lactate transferase/gluconeogenesis factor (CofD/UPF0052 family)
VWANTTITSIGAILLLGGIIAVMALTKSGIKTFKKAV